MLFQFKILVREDEPRGVGIIVAVEKAVVPRRYREILFVVVDRHQFRAAGIGVIGEALPITLIIPDC